MIVRRLEGEAEIGHFGLGTDSALEIGCRGLWVSYRAGNRPRSLPHQQRVGEVAAIEFPLEVAQAEIGNQRLALVRGELEAARADVFQHRHHTETHTLQLVCGVLFSHQAGARGFTRPFQVEQDGIALLDRKRRSERSVDRNRREQLTVAPGQVEGLLRAREERDKGVVDPLDVDPRGAPAALGLHDAPLHQDCRRYQPVAGRELGILAQLVPQAVPKETGTEQGMVDPAEPVEGQVPQASSHRVANHQGAGEHGRRDGGSQHDGDVGAPVVPQTGQGSAGPGRTHDFSLRLPVAAALL